MKRLTKKEKAKRKTLWKKIRKIYDKGSKELKEKTPYRTFKKLVRAKVKSTDKTWEEAAKEEVRTRKFTSAEQVAKENFFEGLKGKFRDTYDEMRGKMHLRKGEKMWDRIMWDDDKKMYSFTNHKGEKFWVDISNSPEEAYILG